MMIRGIARVIGRTIRLARDMRGNDLRSYARGYLDQALAGYGYVRRPGGLSQWVPMAGAFGAGVAVGTGIGVLIAPASGAETRARITKELRTYLREAERATRRANGEGRVITEDPDIERERPIHPDES